MNKFEIFDHIKPRSLMAVLVVDQVKEAVNAANALIKGGVSVIELALRTPIALEAMKAVVDSCPEMIVGAGTVLQPKQIESVKKAGAHFALSPGINTDVILESHDCDLPFIPGIATPSELQEAINVGSTCVKLFPVEPLGGVPYLKSISEPYKHLNIKYVPLGGISMKNFNEYLSYSEVIAIGGSWLTPKTLIKEQSWDKITSIAKESIGLIKK